MKATPEEIKQHDEEYWLRQKYWHILAYVDNVGYEDVDRWYFDDMDVIRKRMEPYDLDSMCDKTKTPKHRCTCGGRGIRRRDMNRPIDFNQLPEQIREYEHYRNVHMFGGVWLDDEKAVVQYPEGERGDMVTDTWEKTKDGWVNTNAGRYDTTDRSSWWYRAGKIFYTLTRWCR